MKLETCIIFKLFLKFSDLINHSYRLYSYKRYALHTGIWSGTLLQFEGGGCTSFLNMPKGHKQIKAQVTYAMDIRPNFGNGSHAMDMGPKKYIKHCP